jgi:hypothetical protein
MNECLQKRPSSNKQHTSFKRKQPPEDKLLTIALGLIYILEPQSIRLLATKSS